MKVIRDKGLFMRQIFFMVLDVATILAASIIALWLRFNLSLKGIEDRYQEHAWQLALPNILITLVIFWFFGLYHSKNLF